MTGRVWEIRLVKPGDVVAPDEKFTDLNGTHHGRYRVGHAAREVTPPPAAKTDEVAR